MPHMGTFSSKDLFLSLSRVVRGQIQLPEAVLGVCAEHFVKVPQTEKQDGISPF